MSPAPAPHTVVRHHLVARPIDTPAEAASRARCVDRHRRFEDLAEPAPEPPRAIVRALLLAIAAWGLIALATQPLWHSPEPIPVSPRTLARAAP